jgi:hypothetical protein
MAYLLKDYICDGEQYKALYKKLAITAIIMEYLSNFPVRMDIMRIVDGFKGFVRREDPIVWKSLLVAAAITLAFYIFVLVYTR